MLRITSIAALALLLAGFQNAQAEECSLSIDANDAMAFNLEEMSVPASCKDVTVTINHTGNLPSNVMGHNWVLTTAADFQGVAKDGMGAGLDNNYLPTDDSRVLAATKIVGGGESDSVTFSTDALTAGEEYMYFCSFPGHWSVMKGGFKLQ